MSTPNSRKWQEQTALAKRSLRNDVFLAQSGIERENESRALNRRELMRGEINVATYRFKVEESQLWINRFEANLKFATRHLARIQLSAAKS